MVLRSPLQMPHSVIASMSLLMALRVVVTMQGDSSWQFDQGQVYKVGKEAHNTL
jgi:hypothetical protein